MHERDFFDERPETKPATFTCAKCRHRDEYQVPSILRTKKDPLPTGADGRDRAMFGKLRDYLIRIDDALPWKWWQRRLQIHSEQAIVFA
jgi:hypothetical protein